MDTTIACVVCGVSALEKPSAGGDYTHIDCPRCGEFQITRTVQSMLEKNKSDEQIAKLSGWIRANQVISENVPVITSDVLNKIYRSELPTYSLRLKYLLMGIYEGLNRIGDQFNVNEEKFIAISYSKDKKEAQALFKHLSETGFIKHIAMGGSAEITPEGYQEIENITNDLIRPEADKHPDEVHGDRFPTAGTAPSYGSMDSDPNERSEFVGPNVFVRNRFVGIAPSQELPGIVTASKFLERHNYPATQALCDLFSIARVYARYRSPDGNQLSSSTLLYAMIDGWQEHLRSPLDTEVAVLKLLQSEIRLACEPDVSELSRELFDCKNFKDDVAKTIPEFENAERLSFDLIDFSDVVHTRFIESVLSCALRNSNKVHDDDEISVAMFAVCFFASPSKSLHDRLEFLGIDNAYIAAQAAQAASFEDPIYQKRWAILSQEVGEQNDIDRDNEVSYVDLLSQRAGTLSDTIDPTEDKLDFSARAMTFAKLIADRDLQLPLAVGLFGDWGTGKSFFMELIKKGVGDLCAQGINNGTGATEFVGRVAQIDFNAWHYTDANLWASLASRVFDGLMKEFIGQHSLPAEIRAKLNSQIRSSKEHLQEAKAEKEVAVELREDAEKELEKARADRRQASKALGTRILNIIESDSAKKATLKAVTTTAEYFGIEHEIISRDDIEQIAAEIKNTTYGFRAIVQRLKRIFRSGFASFVFVLFASLAVLFFMNLENLAEFLVSWLPGLKAPLDVISKFISAESGGFIGIVASAAAWCGDQARRASAGLKSANNVLEFFDELSSESAASNQGILDARKRLDDAIESVHISEQNVLEAEHRLGAAVKELSRVNSGGLVYDFLSERLTESEYTRNLGLISVIREDLGNLRELMADWQNVASENKIDSGRSSIERIVLYVDDLDRCHPDRVVEVLQAVHLLLAFDLFVVVVAVDPRWLERSLYKEYLPELPDLIVMTEEQSKKAKGYFDFSPHNYLEKIFQIPFCLPSMGEAGFQDLMAHLSRERVTNGNASISNTLDIERAEGGELMRSIPEAADNTLSEAKSNSEFEETASGFEGESMRSETGGNERPLNDAPPNQTAIKIPALLESESSCLGCMHAFIKTPRLAKRLVNIYRLIRIHKIQRENSAEWLTNQDEKAHVGLIFLLALNIGYPNIGGSLFVDLRKKTIPEKLYDGADGEWRLKEVLEEFNWLSAQIAGGENGFSPQYIPSFKSYGDQEELQRFIADMHKVRTLLERTDQSIDDIPIHVLRNWVEEVERYSFDWNRKGVELL